MPYADPLFGGLSGDEIRALTANLFGLLPQRGCSQACAGCSAMAFPKISAAPWERILSLTDSFRRAADHFNIAFQGGVPEAYRYLNVFRDADPAHYRFRSRADKNEIHGIGDFVELLSSTLQARAKIITSGLPAKPSYQIDDPKPSPVLNPLDRMQLSKAAFHAARTCVSVSVQTRQQRLYGAEANAFILARTFEDAAEGARPETDVFFDMMYYSPGGTDSETTETIDLFHRVLRQLDERLVNAADKALMAKYLSPDNAMIAGDRNTTLLFDKDRRRGLRLSPHLRIGRAVQAENGMDLSDVLISDRLGVLPGGDADTISLSAEKIHFSASRKQLRDSSVISELVSALRRLDPARFLSEQAEIAGNWLAMFRGEIDLTDPAGIKTSNPRASSPGRNLPAGINLILSSFKDNETQMIVPFKPIYVS